MRLLGSLCLQRREAAILMRFVKQYCAALVWVCSRRSEHAFPTLPQVQDAARATFGQQRMGYYPRRYSDYIPQELYQEKINAHFQKSKPPLGNARRPGRAGNPAGAHGDLARIWAQVQAAARTRDQAFARWTRDARTEIRRRQAFVAGQRRRAFGLVWNSIVWTFRPDRPNDVRMCGSRRAGRALRQLRRRARHPPATRPPLRSATAASRPGSSFAHTKLE